MEYRKRNRRFQSFFYLGCLVEDKPLIEIQKAGGESFKEKYTGFSSGLSLRCLNDFQREVIIGNGKYGPKFRKIN